MKDADIYKAIFERPERAMAVIDSRTGYFADANDAFCRITYSDRNTLLSQKDIQFLFKDKVREKDLEQYQQTIMGDSNPFTGHCQLQNGSGGIIYLKIKIVPHITENHTLLILEDITASAFSIEEWKERGQLYEYLFDFAPVGLWEEDLSGVVGYLRSMGLDKLSYSESLAYFNAYPDVVHRCLCLTKITNVNRSVLERLDIPDKSCCLTTLDQFITTRKSFNAVKQYYASLCTTSDMMLAEMDGSTAAGKHYDILIKWQITPAMKRNGYHRIIVSTIDITSLKETQKKFEETLARAQTIVDTIDGIIWTADPRSLRINFISEKIKEITGYPRRFFLGKKIFDFDIDFFTDKHIMNTFRENIIKGVPGTLEYRIKTQTGIIKWLQINTSFIKVRDQISLILAVVVDITNLKQSKEDLRHSLAILSEQNKRFMEVSYIVSHNLRSHSSSILGLCDLIKETNKTEEQKEYLQLLSDAAERLHNATEGLDQGTHAQVALNEVRESLNLREYIDKSYQRITGIYRKKDVVFRNNVQESVWINFSRPYMENVLFNLISNAVKYSRPDRKPEIQVDFFSTQKVLKVTDNGIGIDLTEKRKYLFGLFKTFSTDRSSKGIGLYITRNQVEAMGGKIEVESEPDKGSCFKIYFQ